jgi:hypothetical protein
MLKQDDKRSTDERTSQIAFAVDALRAVVFVNGGAVIALLTFLGQAWSKNELQVALIVSALRPGLLLFVAGTVCGISAQGFAYLSQLAFGDDRQKAGRVLRNICIALGGSGIVFFSAGALSTLLLLVRS